MKAGDCEQCKQNRYFSPEKTGDQKMDRKRMDLLIETAAFLSFLFVCYNSVHFFLYVI